MSDGLVPWRQNSAVFLLLSFCFLDNRCSSSSYTTITVWLCGNSYDGARWIWKVSATANCRRLEYAHQLLNKRPDTVLSWLTPLLAIVAGLYGYAKVELVGVWLESFTLVRVTLKLSGKKKIQPLWIIMNTITPWSRDSLSLLKEAFFFFFNVILQSFCHYLVTRWRTKSIHFWSINFKFILQIEQITPYRRQRWVYTIHAASLSVT